MDSLIALAEIKKLPAHQFMDNVTLNWIISNNPFKEQKIVNPFKTSKIFKKLDSYRLPEEWFLTPEEVNTIHGLRHVLRVAINGLNLLQYGFSENNYENTVFVSALLHDISRRDDHADEGHAIRSATWFMKNEILIRKTFFQLSEVEKEDVYYAILLHEEPLEKLIEIPEYLSHKRIVDILKIADALDRYRLPKLKWWINDEKIPFSPPVSAKHFAFELVVKSELNYLRGLGNYTGVLEALKEI